MAFRALFCGLFQGAESLLSSVQNEKAGSPAALNRLASTVSVKAYQTATD